MEGLETGCGVEEGDGSVDVVGGVVATEPVVCRAVRHDEKAGDRGSGTRSEGELRCGYSESVWNLLGVSGVSGTGLGVGLGGFLEGEIGRAGLAVFGVRRKRWEKARVRQEMQQESETMYLEYQCLKLPKQKSAIQ